MHAYNKKIKDSDLAKIRDFLLLFGNCSSAKLNTRPTQQSRFQAGWKLYIFFIDLSDSKLCKSALFWSTYRLISLFYHNDDVKEKGYIYH